MNRGWLKAAPFLHPSRSAAYTHLPNQRCGYEYGTHPSPRTPGNTKDTRMVPLKAAVGRNAAAPWMRTPPAAPVSEPRALCNSLLMRTDARTTDKQEKLQILAAETVLLGAAVNVFLQFASGQLDGTADRPLSSPTSAPTLLGPTAAHDFGAREHYRRWKSRTLNCR